MNIAPSSFEETKYYLILLAGLKYINRIDYQKLLDLSDEADKMLYGFYKKLNSEP